MDLDLRQKWQQYQYYVIIGVVSLVALFFLPMLGSEMNLVWRVPNTVAGWVVYIVSKLFVAALNVLIFHCFILQAKVNIRDDPKYIEAALIMLQLSTNDNLLPRSPEEYNKQIYTQKGCGVFAVSVLSAIGLTQAVLTFDWISLLTYFFTILMGVIFGILQMNQAEIYWTTEYWNYAKRIEAEKAIEGETEESLEVVESEPIEQVDDYSDNSGGTDLLEPTDSNSLVSDLQ